MPLMAKFAILVCNATDIVCPIQIVIEMNVEQNRNQQKPLLDFEHAALDKSMLITTVHLCEVNRYSHSDLRMYFLVGKLFKNAINVALPFALK